MRRTKAITISTILLLAGLLTGPGPASAAAWQENVGLQAQIGGVTASAQIYDSDDYQRMLLVLEDRPAAFVLDLAAASVFEIPRDSVRVGENGEADIGGAQIELLTGLDQKEGILSFTADESAIAVCPIPPLIGQTDLARILELKPAYATYAKEYIPDAKSIAALKGVSTDTQVHVFFGTWCVLCKKIVPAFIRTMEVAGNSRIHVTYYGVDEDLTEPEREIKQHSLSKTPTFIVTRGGRELGRIEEKTNATIEADLASILAPKK